MLIPLSSNPMVELLFSMGRTEIATANYETVLLPQPDPGSEDKRDPLLFFIPDEPSRKRFSPL